MQMLTGKTPSDLLQINAEATIAELHRALNAQVTRACALASEAAQWRAECASKDAHIRELESEIAGLRAGQGQGV